MLAYEGQDATTIMLLFREKTGLQGWGPIRTCAGSEAAAAAALPSGRGPNGPVRGGARLHHRPSLVPHAYLKNKIFAQRPVLNADERE